MLRAPLVTALIFRLCYYYDALTTTDSGGGAVFGAAPRNWCRADTQCLKTPTMLCQHGVFIILVVFFLLCFSTDVFIGQGLPAGREAAAHCHCVYIFQILLFFFFPKKGRETLAMYKNFLPSVSIVLIDSFFFCIFHPLNWIAVCC